MKIDFYEEFPKEGLKKLKLINFPSRVFLAAKSVKEFKEIEEKAEKINKKIKCAYWPIVKSSYWISPFSNTKDLAELFRELEKIKTHILIDLEFPLNKKLILKNVLKLRKNKKLIREFLEQNKKRITTAQFPRTLISNFLKIIGFDYNINTEKSLMFYSSMNSKKINKHIKKILMRIKNKENISISLGTTAKGILGNEPILSPENLEKDLDFVKKAGFNKAVIFRIGGLNKRYIKVINRFLK